MRQNQSKVPFSPSLTAKISLLSTFLRCQSRISCGLLSPKRPQTSFGLHRVKKERVAFDNSLSLCFTQKQYFSLLLHCHTLSAQRYQSQRLHNSREPCLLQKEIKFSSLSYLVRQSPFLLRMSTAYTPPLSPCSWLLGNGEKAVRG